MLEAYLCAEAIANGSEFLDAQILERLDGSEDDGVDVRGSVRVVTSRALGQPRIKVKVASSVQLKGIAVEEIWEEDGVALSSKVVGQQLAVLPDAKDIGNEEDTLAIASLVRRGCGQIGVNVAFELDVLASSLTPK